MFLEDLNEVGFFEGTEKLLEIWFEFSRKNADLRNIPRYELDELLKVVNAEIVSHTSNDHTDSYVLSESSMFISQNRFVIKTCGITKLLYSVQCIINLVDKYCEKTKIQDFFYSRRVYMRPEEQDEVHQAFQDEINFLLQIIPGTLQLCLHLVPTTKFGGSPYVFGRIPSEQWYLFVMNNNNTRTPSEDVTLEVLMTDLDVSTMRNFTKSEHETSKELIETTGIGCLVPGSINDGLVFDPIGYSLNGLFKDSYYTIHVTPQPMCSYASFETNLKLKDYTALINRVVTTFKPKKFIVTLFANKNAACGSAIKTLDETSIGNYICFDKDNAQLETYSVAYHTYLKNFID